MTRGSRLLLGLVLLALAVAGGALALVVVRGVSARDEPTAAEAFLARRMRSLAIPSRLRARANPVPPSAETLASARAHFADHCASCHGNDGRGQTPLGRNMYPKAPDMTLPETQRLADGELFAIIENGVRLTGMPAWGSPGPEDDGETWELVHFIRHLPEITPQELGEMKEMNPKTKKEREEEEAIRRFLGGEAPPPEAGSHAH
jgi:mono/diheme cytochrome c family protein